MSQPVPAYDPRAIETKWQRHWKEQGTFRASNPGDPDFDPKKPKWYVLDMFPYPSGSGLHVGHAVGYIGTDVVARKKRMEGFNVLHPMGWDAFGLPAEQYAIQTGKHPRETTAENTKNFKRQLELLGLSYDWSREIDTSDPRYYRWTQWIFLRLFERGLAYQAEVPVWWCEELKTVLANEEVIAGRSERGNHPCVRRPLKQWMLRITSYADRLLADLDLLDWPESIKTQQREWIGRSEGAEIRFELETVPGEHLLVFTTRPDTIFGATFMVIAPEHPLVAKLATASQRAAVDDYLRSAAQKSELERSDLSKEKTGVFTGSHAWNPAFERGDPRAKIPVFVADYVLATYGTGAIMAVPGQDQRDWDFAKKYDLRIVRTVEPTPGFEGEAFLGEGRAVNSGWLDGLGVQVAKRAAIAWLEARSLGRARTTYKLRDWLFSRQRYWGEPFPLLHVADGKIVALPDDALPVELPAMDDFKPSADGSAPLARAQEWVRTRDPRTGESARRDTDTMPGWAGSCWYWLRFMDPANDAAPFAREAERYWGPVDLYVGGAAHAVMHLLYARFWHKVLFDAGVVSTREPFQKLFNQGLVEAFAYQDATGRLVPSDEVEDRGGRFFRRSDGAELAQIVTKMAKSLRNVVNPDDIVAEHGADTVRLYEMFMGPLADSKPWNPRDIPGCRRFLDRSWRLVVDPDSSAPVRPGLARGAPEKPIEGATLALERELARALQLVNESFRHLNLNTAIAGLMTFLNEATKNPEGVTRDQASRFVRALAPFAPHLAEELWERMGESGGVSRAPWPIPEPRYLVEDELEIAVQVLGRLRGTARIPKDADRSAQEAAARDAVSVHLDGKSVVKVIVVPGKLVNFVVK
ncbi:MAG TPA: leucine--tRNA ligase [Planctomycetota bacterium]|jgi:leucyl-tRNA synthetase|nr:leucine--tRNA ligase [Planctomycetota bacterium]